MATGAHFLLHRNMPRDRLKTGLGEMLQVTVTLEGFGFAA
jgi:hypothetical protein